MCLGLFFSFKIIIIIKLNCNYIFVYEFLLELKWLNLKIFKKYFDILLFFLFCFIVDLKNKKLIYLWKVFLIIIWIFEVCLKGI